MSKRKARSQGATPATGPATGATSATGPATGATPSATSRWPLVVRIVSFVAAAALTIAGIIGLTGAIRTQSAAQSITSSSVRAASVRHVLVLMSHDESDASTAVERDGLQSVFAPSGIQADFFYLDRNSVPGTDYDSSLLAQIAAKAAATTPYDAVVCAGNEALSYALASQEVLAGLPVAFFAVDDASLADEAHAAGIATGIVEQGALAAALDAAAAALPEATRAVILHDLNSVPGTDYDSGSALECEAWDVSRLTRAELADRLSALDPARDVVLLVAASSDATGATFTHSDTVHWLAAATKAPVFTTGGGVGEGAVGAAFINRRQEAADAAVLAADLLNGTDPASVATRVAAPECAVYDVQAATAAGVDVDRLPETSALVNEATLSWRVLRPMLRPLLYLLGALVCIGIFGIIGFSRQRSSRQAIIRSNRDLQHRLTHDLLTELPNRQALERFAAAKGAPRQMRAAVQIDIEDFSDINDSYGHAFGNEVICEVARRLEEVPSTLLARSGGDEFILCFDHALTPESAELAQVAATLREPFDISGNRVELSFRSGVANAPENRNLVPGTDYDSAAPASPEELITSADLACQFAKATGERTPVFYDDAMRAAMERKIEITAHLKRALAEEAVDVVWQPQVDVRTLKVYGFEALCRLRDGAYGPADFIPAAETSGLVLPLDRLVTRKVVEQLAAWRAEGREPGVASVNFSAAQLRDEGYADFLAGLLAEHDVPGSLIKIEITESMLLGNEEAAEALFARLKELGISLALDDFGCGYSSLAQMAKLPADFVKLDKSLVDAYMVPGREVFIDHICQLVHDLGKKLVVEGVETAEQFAICRRLGADIIQGYFFSRPVAPAEAVAFDPMSVPGAADAADEAPKAEDSTASQPSKTRNPNWSRYTRDSKGRWTKS